MSEVRCISRARDAPSSVARFSRAIPRDDDARFSRAIPCDEDAR